MREINSLEFAVLLTNEENNDLSVPALMGISLWHPPEWEDGGHSMFNRKKNVCQGIVVPLAGLMEIVMRGDSDDRESAGLVFSLLSLTALWSLFADCRCPVTFLALSGKVKSGVHSTLPVLYSFLNSSFPFW